MITLAELQSRIAAVRRKERRVVFMAGFFRTLVALVAAVLAYFVMDLVFELPYAARLVFASAGLAAVGYVTYKHLIRELRRIQDDDEIALRVETRNADLHGRLISTLQLARASKTGEYVGSPELIAALEAETTRMSEPLDFFRIINTEMVVKFGVAAALIVAIKVALVIKFPEYYSALGTRLVRPNAHFPTKTHIKVIKATGGGFERSLFPEGQAGVVPRGEELLVEVTIDGSYIPQQSGILAYKSLARDVTVPIELLP
ncbi:MAG: hypothetical protein NTW87_14810, partial [Planctomycetota bacterium]|nr:hypothetical protein [Planctomycetota bacterium]